MQLRFFKKSLPTFLFLVVFAAFSIPIFYHLLKVDAKLKVYNPNDVNPKLVDESLWFVKKNHRINDFKLTNQFGETITQQTFSNKIYIADFFFTRCQSICIPMAYNMIELQNYYKNDADILFLSHSVTPEMDSVSVLKKYADEKGAIKGKWHITTGDKKQIYELARKNYMAVLDEGDGGDQDFIHTEQFILIDKKQQIRGYYDGTKQDEMEKLKKDIAILKLEYK